MGKKNELERSNRLFSLRAVWTSTNLRSAIFIVAIAVACLLLLTVSHQPDAAGTPKDVTLSESDLLVNDQVKVLTVKANLFLAKMKSVCVEQGLESVGLGVFVPTSGRILQMEGEENGGPHLQLKSKDYTFEFWMENNQLATFINEDLQDRLYGKDAPPLDAPDTPKLTELQAKQMAKRWLTLVEIPDGIKLAVPHLKFEPQTNLPTYRYGWWDVAWARTDEEGHVFGCDHGVSLDLPESYGPVSIRAGLRVPYTKDEGPLLSQESALSLARAEIDKSRAGFVTTPIPNDVGIIDDKPFDSSLTIIEALPKAPWWAWWAKPKRTTRLAWQIWFEPEFATPIIGPMPDHRFVISIDSHTGAVIGVEAML